MGELFQLVLVDDKKDLVQGIAAGVDWEAKGVEVSCFYNGRDALAHILEHHPDMVITDIRMPYLDGLELARETVKVYEDIRFIILTGYDEFTYAREALRLGVVEYLSKPVRLEAIEELVDKGVELARKRQQKEQGQAVIRRQYKKGLPSLRSQWFSGFLRQNKELDQGELEARFGELEIGLAPERFVAAVAELDVMEREEQGTEEEDTGLLLYAIENIGKELLRKEFPCETFQCGTRRLAFLMNYEEGKSPIVSQYELFSRLSRLQGMMKDCFHVSVSVGIGGRAGKITELRRSYRQAADALEQKFYSGRGAILSVYDMPDQLKTGTEGYSYRCQDELLQAVREGRLEEGLKLLAAYIQALREMKYTRPSAVRDKMAHFLLRICHECEKGEEIQIAGLLTEFEKRRTLDGIEEWMTGFLTYLINQTREQAVSDIRKNILKVKAYIDENFAETVSLKKMSEMVYISPSYLSFSFKEIVGINFNDYVTRVRMERAKELLRNSDYKVYEVCELVGYRDKKYFSDLFKKYTGVLPKEWSRRENE